MKLKFSNQYKTRTSAIAKSRILLLISLIFLYEHGTAQCTSISGPLNVCGGVIYGYSTTFRSPCSYIRWVFYHEDARDFVTSSEEVLLLGIVPKTTQVCIRWTISVCDTVQLAAQRNCVYDDKIVLVNARRAETLNPAASIRPGQLIILNAFNQSDHGIQWQKNGTVIGNGASTQINCSGVYLIEVTRTANSVSDSDIRLTG